MAFAWRLMARTRFLRLGELLKKGRGPAALEAGPENERRLLEVCALSPEDSLRNLGTSERGLSAEEVERRRGEFGPNEVIQKKGGFWSRMFRRFANPLVIQLLVIALVSLLMGDLEAALVVAAMILISVALSIVQEERSGQAVEKLRAMVRTTANVLRDGKETEIPLAEIVPGDIVVLDAGSLVPADLRLTSAKDFFVSQSALTGESMPVEKSRGAAHPEPDRAGAFQRLLPGQQRALRHRARAWR